MGWFFAPGIETVNLPSAAIEPEPDSMGGVDITTYTVKCVTTTPPIESGSASIASDGKFTVQICMGRIGNNKVSLACAAGINEITGDGLVFCARN